MKRKLPLFLLCLFFLGITGFFGSRFLAEWKALQKEQETYTALAQYVQLDIPDPQSQTPAPVLLKEETPTQPTQPQEEILWPQVDFDALQAINPDVAAWIHIEGTNISYPVFQGTDNRYYLKHLIDGSYHSAGSIFLDYRNDPNFNHRHSVIFGHNMRNGTTMFAQLMGYKEQSFYDAHPTGLIVTPEGKFQIRFFAGYITDLNDDAWKLEFGSDEEYALWLEDAAERSLFTADVTPTAQDKTLTLSACTYEFTDARFVLVGILTQQTP